jgi:hypothetical protein
VHYGSSSKAVWSHHVAAPNLTLTLHCARLRLVSITVQGVRAQQQQWATAIKLHSHLTRAVTHKYLEGYIIVQDVELRVMVSHLSKLSLTNTISQERYACRFHTIGLLIQRQQLNHSAL